jgi:NADH-quinone oxidoreductase subunit N
MEHFPILTKDFYLASSPILILCVSSMVTMLLAVSKKTCTQRIFMVQTAGFVLALLSCLYTSATNSYLGGAFLAEEVSRFAQVLILGLSLLLTLFFRENYLKEQYFRGEISALFQLSTLGMLVMTSSVDLITVFVGLELSSIGIYTLVGYINPSRSSQEGAIKYFVLGSLATAFFLLGLSFLYISSGSLNLAEITNHLSHTNDLWLKIGGVFTLFGFAFKLALMPFHMWAPDAYEAAPTGLTAFMAVGVKVMILSVVLRFTRGVDIFFDEWMLCFLIFAALSMIGGNILALVQTSLKRMLAYSSIAHSGYMAIALCAMDKHSDLPYQAILFYLVGYSLTSLVAFGTLMWLESQETENIQLNDLNGLVKKHPWAAVAIGISMFSFAGMPPTVGFFGKFFIFNSALHFDLYPLAIIGVVGSLISLFYYLRVIVFMFMKEQPKNQDSLFHAKPSKIYMVILSTGCAAILLLGTVLPQKALDLIRPVATYLLRT